MKEIAKRFLDKDCIVYTISGNDSTIKGKLVEITEEGILIDCNGNLQAVNLEYVTRIREWPKNKNGKKAMIID